MARQLPTVAVEPDQLDELRTATREAHEAAQELRQAERDLRATREAMKGELESLIRAEVLAAMEVLGEELVAYRDELIARLDKSYASYWASLTGIRDTGPDSVRASLETWTGRIRRIAEVQQQMLIHWTAMPRDMRSELHELLGPELHELLGHELDGDG